MKNSQYPIHPKNRVWWSNIIDEFKTQATRMKTFNTAIYIIYINLIPKEIVEMSDLITTIKKTGNVEKIEKIEKIEKKLTEKEDEKITIIANLNHTNSLFNTIILLLDKIHPSDKKLDDLDYQQNFYKYLIELMKCYTIIYDKDYIANVSKYIHNIFIIIEKISRADTVGGINMLFEQKGINSHSVSELKGVEHSMDSAGDIYRELQNISNISDIMYNYLISFDDSFTSELMVDNSFMNIIKIWLFQLTTNNQQIPLLFKEIEKELLSKDNYVISNKDTFCNIFMCPDLILRKYELNLKQGEICAIFDKIIDKCKLTPQNIKRETERKKNKGKSKKKVFSHLHGQLGTQCERLAMMMHCHTITSSEKHMPKRGWCLTKACEVKRREKENRTFNQQKQEKLKENLTFNQQNQEKLKELDKKFENSRWLFGGLSSDQLFHPPPTEGWDEDKVIEEWGWQVFITICHSEIFNKRRNLINPPVWLDRATICNKPDETGELKIAMEELRWKMVKNICDSKDKDACSKTNDFCKFSIKNKCIPSAEAEEDESDDESYGFGEPTKFIGAKQWEILNTICTNDLDCSNDIDCKLSSENKCIPSARPPRPPQRPPQPPQRPPQPPQRPPPPPPPPPPPRTSSLHLPPPHDEDNGDWFDVDLPPEPEKDNDDDDWFDDGLPPEPEKDNVNVNGYALDEPLPQAPPVNDEDDESDEATVNNSDTDESNSEQTYSDSDPNISTAGGGGRRRVKKYNKSKHNRLNSRKRNRRRTMGLGKRNPIKRRTLRSYKKKTLSSNKKGINTIRRKNTFASKKH